MGSIGKRKVINTIYKEPSLLGNLYEIINSLEDNNFINGCEVDIEKIVKNYGIKLIRDKSLRKDQYGYLKVDINEVCWIIGVNYYNDIKRQRYTMAREFAHYILHADVSDFFFYSYEYSKDNKTTIEHYADIFAKELLIPEYFLRNKIKDGIKKVDKLSKMFNVNISLMRERIIELGYKIKR